MKNYQRVDREMQYELKNLDTLPDLFSVENIRQLEAFGVPILKANYKASRYLTDVNQHISQRINACRDLFPLWIKWDYIKTAALCAEIEPYLESALSLNVNAMLDDAYERTRVSMTDGERKQFYDKYIKTLRLVIDADGEAHIARIKEKLDEMDVAQPTTLRSIYEGKVYPADISYAEVPGYKNLAKRLSAASAGMASFTADSGELDKAVEAYRAASGDMAELIAQEQFTEGFALAVRMIAECQK